MIQGEYEKLQCDPEGGENLMAKRTLCSKKVGKEPILRRSIFKTRCKVAEKCYKVIIDNGISTNLASEELVKKL